MIGVVRLIIRCAPGGGHSHSLKGPLTTAILGLCGAHSSRKALSVMLLRVIARTRRLCYALVKVSR